MGNKSRENRSNVLHEESLSPEFSFLQKNRNTAEAGPLLKIAEPFFPISAEWKRRIQDSQSSQGSKLIISPNELDNELAWLRNGLKRGAQQLEGGKIPYSLAHRIYEIILMDKGEYNESSLDPAKRMIFGKIHAIQEVFARGILQADVDVASKAYALILNDPYINRFPQFYIGSLLHVAGRLMGDTEEMEKIFASSPTEFVNKQVFEFGKVLGEGFKGYRNALIYSELWHRINSFIQGLLHSGMIDQDGYRVIVEEMISLETNLEEKKGVGVGINVFTDPASYNHPEKERVENALDNLENIATNIIPGGSEESPIDYQACITEGMRFYDIWGIKKIHIVGKHPVDNDSSLFLHIAMERSSNKPPLYAFYDIRTGKLFLQIPDITGWGATTELHLHLYALITDLRHFERSGVSIQDDGGHKTAKGDKMKVPIKRTFVVSKQGVHEGPSSEPTGTVYVTPREATLPYGSRYKAAAKKLTEARLIGDQKKILEAQRELDALARYLPTANPINIKRYEDKAESLGLDVRALTLSEDKTRIVTAPRKGFDQPIFTEPSTRRSVRVIPSFGAKVLEVNESFSAEQ